MTTRLNALLWSILVLFTMWVSFVAVVYAHATLTQALPAPGSIVSNPIGQIRLTFSEPVTANSQIILFTDNFQAISGIAAQLEANDPTTLYTSIPDLDIGTYTVQWTAVSQDGHEISGSYAFRVSTAALPIAPQQLWVVGLGILLIGGIVVMWRRTRRPSSVIRKP